MTIPRLQTTEESDWEYLNYALEIEEEWWRSLPRFTDKELLEIFPQAKPIIPEKIAAWEEKQVELTGMIKKKLTLIKRNATDEFARWFWREWIRIIDGIELVKVKGHIERLKRLLWGVKNREPKGRITEEQIQQALAVPIQNLINRPLRKGGKTLFGLCPLHNEKHPSFHVYPATNTCWCYGCGQGGDVITLVRFTHDYSFREAVQYLIGI